MLLTLVARHLPETLPVAARRRDGLSAVFGTYARLLRDRRFLGNALAGMVPLSGMFAYIAGSPFVLMQGHGLSPTIYAFVFGVNAAAFVVAAQGAGWAAARFGAERVLGLVQCAMLTIGAALAAVTQAGLGLPALLPLFALYLAGCGALMPLSVALAMAPHGRVAGSASAVLGAMQFGGGAAAVALLGALGGGAPILGALMAGTTLIGLLTRLTLKHVSPDRIRSGERPCCSRESLQSRDYRPD